MLPPNDNGKDDRDQGGSSGQGGKIEFRDFVTGPGNLRDDQLPIGEVKRLLDIHQSDLKDRIEKQRDLIKARKEQKAGNKPRQETGQGLSASGSSNYPPHPILSDKFRGADPQVNPNPSENNVQTNEANRDELQLKYQLTHQPELRPGQKFNPTPQR